MQFTNEHGVMMARTYFDFYGVRLANWNSHCEKCGCWFSAIGPDSCKHFCKDCNPDDYRRPYNR